MKNCDGIGISGTNENSNSNLKSYAKTKKIRAIHAAETQDSANTSKKITGKTEVQRAMLLNPSFLIHMTFATNSDLKLAAKIHVELLFVLVQILRYQKEFPTFH